MPYYLAGVWSKLQAYMARMILILQLSHNACDGVISNDIDPYVVMAAAAVIRYFKSHISKVYHELFNSEMDRKVEIAVAWIKMHGGQVSARMMQMNNVAKSKSAHEVQDLFLEMVERDLGKITKVVPSCGGRPSIVFTLHAKENEKNESNKM